MSLGQHRMIVIRVVISEGWIFQVSIVLPSRELNKHGEIFAIILPLKTFHQNLSFPMLGKFHWVFFCISYISAVFLRILTDFPSFRNSIVVNYLIGMSASIVV